MAAKVAKRAIGKKAKTPSNTMYRMKITLLDAPVPIWRRVAIKADTPLNMVHESFQIVMGWWETHSHDFEANGRHFGDLRTADAHPKVEDEREFVLGDLVSAAGDKFVYLYDFGDSWRHEVFVEELHLADGDGFVTCLGGRRACPPEDVGGVEGYRLFLDKIEDPANEEGLELLDWVGGDFDADSFDLRGVNLRLILMQQAILGIEG